MVTERVLNVTGAGMGWARRRPWGPMAAGAWMVLADIAREAPGAWGERGNDYQHRLDRGLRRADRAGGLRGARGGGAAMTLPIAREHARYGIRAVTIAPGISGMPGMAGLPQDLEDTLSRTVPSRRASAVRLKTPASSCTPARTRC